MDMGVSFRTIQRYLDYDTFACTRRVVGAETYNIPEGTRWAQNILQKAEIKAARRLVRAIPDKYRNPALVSFAQKIIGEPERDVEGDLVNGPSKQVFSVIFRTLRRLQNKRQMCGSGHRDKWVTQSNLPSLLEQCRHPANIGGRAGPLAQRIENYVKQMKDREWWLGLCVVRRGWRKWRAATAATTEAAPPALPPHKRQKRGHTESPTASDLSEID